MIGAQQVAACATSFLFFARSVRHKPYCNCSADVLEHILFHNQLIALTRSPLRRLVASLACASAHLTVSPELNSLCTGRTPRSHLSLSVRLSVCPSVFSPPRNRSSPAERSIVSARACVRARARQTNLLRRNDGADGADDDQSANIIDSTQATACVRLARKFAFGAKPTTQKHLLLPQTFGLLPHSSPPHACPPLA